jgi:hypothetical protein
MLALRSMKRSLGMLTWPVAALLLSLAAGCENDSPGPGEACDSVGGVCTTGACGESLPYPCPGNQSCCVPLPEGGR